MTVFPELSSRVSRGFKSTPHLNDVENLGGNIHSLSSAGLVSMGLTEHANICDALMMPFHACSSQFLSQMAWGHLVS